MQHHPLALLLTNEEFGGADHSFAGSVDVSWSSLLYLLANRIARRSKSWST
jgi:hypothetical protein